MLPGLGPKLPERIARLDELANNLWWSWHEDARDLFRALDYSLWRVTGHNPVKELLEMSPDKLQAAATDPDFLAQYDAVIAEFDANLASRILGLRKDMPICQVIP